MVGEICATVVGNEEYLAQFAKKPNVARDVVYQSACTTSFSRNEGPADQNIQKQDRGAVVDGEIEWRRPAQYRLVEPIGIFQANRKPRLPRVKYSSADEARWDCGFSQIEKTPSDIHQRKSDQIPLPYLLPRSLYSKKKKKKKKKICYRV